MALIKREIMPRALFVRTTSSAPRKVENIIVACVIRILTLPAFKTGARSIARFVLWFYVLLPVVCRHAKPFLYLFIEITFLKALGFFDRR